MLIRNSQGIAANKVFLWIKKDIRFVKNGWIYFYDIGWNILLYLLYVHSVLCDAYWANLLYCPDYFLCFGIAIWVLFMLAISKLLKAAMSQIIRSKF